VSATKESQGKQRLRDALRSDFQEADLKSSMQRDLREMKEFFLSEDEKQRLERMSPFYKLFYIPFWITRAMMLRLTPLRRILLLVGAVLLLFVHDSGQSGLGGAQLVGALLFLFVLVLELKDKILARDELEAGRAVQIALMPDERPVFRGWDLYLYTHPANDVGGDLVDYIYVNDDRLGLSLGDVAGKGLGAALFMAKLQATLRAIAPGRASIRDFGAQLSEIFDRDGLPNRFASLVYLEITKDSGEVTLLNAGHMPPLIARKGNVEEMPRGGPALGLLLHRNYEEQCVELEHEDVLLVFSDGVTEARNAQGEFFGDIRLKKLLERYASMSAAELGAVILDRVSSFSAGSPQHDDLSLMIIRRAIGAPSSPATTDTAGSQP